MVFWDRQRNELLRTMKEHTGLSYKEIAHEFAVRFPKADAIFTKESIRSAYRRIKPSVVTTLINEEAPTTKLQYNTAYIPLNVDGVSSVDLPDPLDPGFAPPTELFLDSVLVVADIHVPFHNVDFFRKAVKTAKSSGVNTLIIAGDLTTQDSVQQHHARNAPHVPFNEEMLLAGQLLVELSQHFSTIYICSGNHDERLAKAANTDLRLKGLIQYALSGRATKGTIITTEYDYFDALFPSGSKWKFGHLNRYSKRAGDVARGIAERHKCNVAAGHDHIQGFSSTSDGKYIGISIGSMIDLDQGRTRFWYAERRMDSFQATQNGFLIVQNGVPYLYNTNGRSSLNGGGNWE